MTTKARPTTTLIAGQYSSPNDQTFAPSPPQQYGHAMPIPQTNNGNIAQTIFHKINNRLTLGKPLAKIVIGTQQARF